MGTLPILCDERISMAIATGETIPDVTVTRIGEDGPDKVRTGDFFAGRKVVLFAVPGAFTPTCHNNHMPGFVENADAIREKGIDEIAVVSVNDPFVMGAWATASNAKGKVTFLSDGNGDFASAIGMDMDMSMGGMGVRSKRYSMIVDDGKVVAVNVEDSPGEATKSGAANIMSQL